MTKIWRQLIVVAVFIVVAAPRVWTQDAAQLVGDWRGESICLARRNVCHDEQVIYHFALKPDTSDVLTLTADKIVDGKPETMGVLDFKYDRDKRTLTSEQRYGVWKFTVAGNKIEGSLILPDNTLMRRVSVQKDK